MEERKLNFNAPLMSVRRSSMASGSLAKANEKKPENSQLSRRNTLPVTRPQFNLDQVTEPVAVPFHWEQIPGRAKNDSGSASPEIQLPQPPERTCTTPRLSFGRALDVKKHGSETEACHRNGLEANSSNAIVVRLESMKAIINDTRSLASEDDDDDDNYSDALDTLSPSASFSVNNCSVSGISGYNGPMVKPSGTFRTDPQTRDFMMSRFLPAAKAMVLEPAKYSLKKQLVAVEQPRQTKKVTTENRRTSPLKLLESTMLLQYGKDDVDKESDIVDDEYDEYDNSGNISARGCGLIPNICFKNSLCLLNPVLGMRIRTESPMSFTNKVGGSSRTMHQSHSQKIKKHAWDAALKQKSEAAVGSPRLQKVKDKWIGESNPFPSSTDLQTRGRSSPFRHSRAASPFRNEASWSPCRKQSLVIPQEVKIISKSKDDTDFHDTPSIRASKQGVDMASTLIEKTLYIDTASVAEITPPLNSSLLDAEKKVDRASAKKETAIETRTMEETTTAEPSFLEVKCLTLVEEGKLEREVAESKSKDVMDDGSKMDHGYDKEEFSGCPNLGTADEDEYCKANYQIVKVEDPASVRVTSVISSQPPPLPKSPSESWLWRTLPSVSSKKLLAGSNLGNKLYHKQQSPRASVSNTKWETIVKSSNLRHDHVRYSEELIPRVSQHSTTENFK